MKGLVKVSIITPSMNSEKYIENCLKSIHLDQKGEFSLEHIIVDGNSTDRTIEIAEAFKKKHGANIKILRGKDKNMYDAINKGLRAMTGDIWACLNTDDLYYPGTINAVVNEFNRNPGLDVVYGYPDMIDENGKFTHTLYLPEFKLDFLILKGYSRTILQPASFLRRRVLDTVGYFDINYKYASDYDYFIRVGAKCKMKLIKRSIMQFRAHPGAITRSERTKSVQNQESLAISKKYIELFGIKKRNLFWDNLMIYLHFNNTPYFLKQLINHKK